MEVRRISQQNINTLNKWAQGAIVRRKFTKIIVTNQIANLKYPDCYMDEKLKMSNERLFTDEEVQDMLDPQRGGKGLFWNNLYLDIGNNKSYQG